MRTKHSKFLQIGLVAAVLALLISGCSSDNIDMAKVTAVLDVRTPSEFAAGHLQGALNIDVEGPDFNTAIQALAKDGNYVVYCHSGRRAGLAIDQMHEIGFNGTLTNAGGIDAAANATGLPVVTN